MPALFSDNFDGEAIDNIEGRVATGGTWSMLGIPFVATVGLNGAGNAVPLGFAEGTEDFPWPQVYAAVPALNNIAAGYLELSVAFNDASAGQVALSISQGWDSGIYVSTGIYIGPGGSTVDIFSGDCSYSTSRVGRTSLALRLEFEPGGSGTLYRLYIDGELVDTKTNSGTPGSIVDVIIALAFVGYPEDFNAVQATHVAIGERTLGPPPAFWTGLVNTYEVP